MSQDDKPLRWMLDTLTSPPVGKDARIEAGFLFRLLQRGESLRMPDSRPMPVIGRRVHELRIDDAERSVSWRIGYRIDDDAILVVDWFEKKTPTTPATVIARCRRRLREYDHGQEETS